MNAIPRLKRYGSPALLSYGFRAFFLFGAIYAGLAVLAWLPMFTGELELSTAFSPVDWHVHEMTYGYLPAVVTGFLLTAIPNWTGRLPIQGMPLLALVAVWVAGRVCVTYSAETGWLVAAIVDVSFPALVVAATAREIIAGERIGEIPASWVWSRCSSLATLRFISRPISKAPLNTAPALVSPPSSCSSCSSAAVSFRASRATGWRARIPADCRYPSVALTS